MATSTPAEDGASPAPRRRPRLARGQAVVLAVVQTVGTMLAARGQPEKLDVLGYALLVASGLALAGRRRHPAATFVVVAAMTVAYQLLDYPSGPTFLALIIALLVALIAGRRRVVWLTTAVLFTVWVIRTDPTFGRAWWFAAGVAGILLFVELPLKATRFVGRMLREQERLHEERRRRKASEERLRIAQELHDVLGHHLSLINIRAGVGRHLMDRQPEQGGAALDTIKETLDTIKEISAEALREVRSVLDMLYPTGQAAPRAPTPGLDLLHELTDDAGLPVHTTISGTPRPLPAEIDRAAYRIVQEALTNVRRHAGAGATARVTIEYRQEDLVMVQIEDDGGAAAPVTTPTAEGNGISGMRERATTLGGSLTAEPRSSGGWRIRAELPLPAPEAAP